MSIEIPVGVIKLHSRQREVFVDQHRFRCIVAGRRWGKSNEALAEIIAAAARAPNQIVWYVSPTYGMARQILWDLVKERIPRKWRKGDPNETRMSIRLRNGSRIMLKGADKPDTLRGVGLNFVVIDEAQDITPDTWYKVLYPTLASTLGRALIIGTPKSFNWLHDVYVLGQRGDTYRDKNGVLRKNSYKSWQFPTITSPFVPPSEIEAARHNLDEKSFRQEFEASFETMAGRVYYAFERKIHVGAYPFNPLLPIWVGQDFNINPMSSVIMQPQPNGEIWVVDECILPGSNTQETADELARRFYRQQNRVVVYPDPAAKNRQSARGESDLDILKDAGFRRLKYRRKHPPVADRVNAVNRMFKSADGAIKMRVNQTCKETIKSLEQTIYKEGSREVDKSAGLEHAADALGYCIDIEFPMRKVPILGVSV